MRIGIVGAGAIGGWIGVRLAKAGHEVSVVARGASLAAIRSHGLRLTSGGTTESAAVKAGDDAGALGRQDVVVIAVKAPALAAAAAAVKALTGPDTIVVPAMNGVPWWFTHGLGGALGEAPLACVDPGGTIAAQIPLRHVIGCVVHASGAVTSPGHVAHNVGRKLILGEPGGAMSTRLATLAGVVDGAGFEAVTSDKIQRDVWYKLWGNMTMNPISALARVTTDRILADPLVYRFSLGVMAEAAETGARIGCPIAESGEDRMAVTRRLGAFKTSMLQDAEAGRTMEIDALLGAPREIAARVGVATPNMDALHGLIRLHASARG
jgi:2-dehydropantoate 2-reductase